MKSFLLDLLFPKVCSLCGDEGRYLCLSCKKNIRPHFRISRLKDGLILISVFRYRDAPVLVKLIKKLKYKFCDDVLDDLNYCFAGLRDFFLQEISESELESYKILAVPLHKKRLAYRGFNQSDLIAKRVQKELKIDILHNLKRVKNTKQQARLERKMRPENLKDAFVYEGKMDLCSNFLLIDDVATSGATLAACANALRKSGAKKILAFVLAKG